MADDLLKALLAGWRYQCEERIHRWKQKRTVSEWHLTVHETLQLLDEIVALEKMADKLVKERDAAVSLVKKLNEDFSESWTARLAVAAERVTTTPPGDWGVQVNGEAFNSLDAVLRRREEKV